MTFNGIGTRLLACSAPDLEGKCTAYWWFTFLYAPILPLRKILFIRQLSHPLEFNYQEADRLPMKSNEIIYTYFKGWMIYPVLIFWPLVMAVIEVYHNILHLPDEYYNYFIGFAITYLIVVVWVLADRYEQIGLPRDWKEKLKELDRIHKSQS